MADGLAEERAFSANLTHFWHFFTLTKRLFIPYFEEKTKRFVNVVSLSISVIDKARVESQKRSGWVLRKSYAPFKKHASFAPTSSSEREQLRFPPSDVRLTPLTALCLPFSGRIFTPALPPIFFFKTDVTFL
jgi:hypothetical protein